MWNISERSVHGSWYHQTHVNNWHFGKRRKVIRTNRWFENWNVIIDSPKLFVAEQALEGYWASQPNKMSSFWIAWRD